ncbi:MAG: hypothetical protein KatS3mg122_1994 [Caldimonas sp.]|nr:MAG: hypothetical protein KatS3mg122_1994 [Caldimonas sp.]
MRQFLRQWLPAEDRLRTHPGLRWRGPLLRRTCWGRWPYGGVAAADAQDMR